MGEWSFDGEAGEQCPAAGAADRVLLGAGIGEYRTWGRDVGVRVSALDEAAQFMESGRALLMTSHRAAF